MVSSLPPKVRGFETRAIAPHKPLRGWSRTYEGAQAPETNPSVTTEQSCRLTRRVEKYHNGDHSVASKAIAVRQGGLGDPSEAGTSGFVGTRHMLLGFGRRSREHRFSHRNGPLGTQHFTRVLNVAQVFVLAEF